VKAIAADSQVPQESRQRVALRNFRHLPKEGCIEAGHLRQFGKSLLSQFDHGDLRRQVQWSETHDRLQRAENLRINASRAIKLFAAMHQSMTDDGEFRQLQR